MRILTVKQPWASAIISGAKTVENRSTNLAGGYRGPVAILAGKREDVTARSHPEVTRWAREYWGTEAGSLFAGDRSKFGHILGVVDLVDVHHAADCVDVGPAVEDFDGNFISQEITHCSPWAEAANVWHLVFANPRPLAEPIPYRGALGFRNLAVNDPATTARILKQIGGIA